MNQSDAMKKSMKYIFIFIFCAFHALVTAGQENECVLPDLKEEEVLRIIIADGNTLKREMIDTIAVSKHNCYYFVLVVFNSNRPGDHTSYIIDKNKKIIEKRYGM